MELALTTLSTSLVSQQHNRAAACHQLRSLSQQPGVFVTRVTQATADRELSCHSCCVDQSEEHVVCDQVFIGVCNSVLQQDLLTKDRCLPTLATASLVNHYLRDQDGLCSAEPTLSVVRSVSSPPPSAQESPCSPRNTSSTPRYLSRRPTNTRICIGCVSNSHGRGSCTSMFLQYCGKLNHFAAVCRSSPVPTTSASEMLTKGSSDLLRLQPLLPWISQCYPSSPITTLVTLVFCIFLFTLT